MKSCASRTVWLALIFLMAFFPYQVLAASITETSAAIGKGCVASGDYSTAMGYETTASGTASTAMGYETTASGGFSTAMGYYTTASGSYSTAMGYGTTAGGRYSFAGGYFMRLTDTADNTFVWGRSDNAQSITTPNAFLIFPAGTAGKVGIGTASPAETLDVRGTTPTARIAAKNAQTSSLQLYEITNDNPYGFEFQYDGDLDKLYLWSRGFSGNETIRMTFNKGGNVGIGITEPTHLLHVNGVARSTQSTWATSSDARVKTDIKPLTGGLEKIRQLNPVTFEYIESYRKGNMALSGKKTGFIAQEVAKVDPTMVHKTVENVDGHRIKDFHLLNTDNLIPMLVAAIKEQQKIIAKQDEENKSLKNDIIKIKEALGIL